MSEPLNNVQTHTFPITVLLSRESMKQTRLMAIEQGFDGRGRQIVRVRDGRAFTPSQGSQQVMIPAPEFDAERDPEPETPASEQGPAGFYPVTVYSEQDNPIGSTFVRTVEFSGEDGELPQLEDQVGRRYVRRMNGIGVVPVKEAA
jgi:hypothetical protein